jgi:tetratricopeptide (TPR) repeat protein
MARAAVKAKQAQKAKVEQAKPIQRRQRRRGHAGGGNPNQQLFFMRLRRRAKGMYLLLAVLFAATFAFLGVGSGSSGLDQLFSNLNIFGHHGTSISKALKETTKHPSNPKGYRDLATAYEAAGKTDAAIGALQTLTRLKPKDSSAWAEMAGLQLTLAQDFASQYQSASATQQAQAPTSPISLSGSLGKVVGTNPIEQNATQETNAVVSNLYQQATGEYGQAVSSYKQVTKLQPGNASAQFQLAQAAQSGGDTTTAIAAYKAYLKLNPNVSTAGQIRQLIKQLSTPTTVTPTATATASTGKKVKSKKK